MTESPKVPGPIRISYDEDPFNLIYADVFRMSYCITTFNLEHSVQLPHEVNEDPRFRYNGHVIMSPQSAKILLQLLQDQVGAYEKIYGNIQIQPKS